MKPIEGLALGVITVAIVTLFVLPRPQGVTPVATTITNVGKYVAASVINMIGIEIPGPGGRRSSGPGHAPN